MMAITKPVRMGDTKPRDWRDELAPSGNAFAGDERNVLIALRAAPDLAGLVRFNEFGLTVEFTRSPPWRKAESGSRWTETDDVQLSAWLQGIGLKLRGTAAVANCIAVSALERAYHPVREFLEEITWDGVARLQAWLSSHLGAEGNQEYLAAIGARFLVSAVARILRPGCQADHVLVLEGGQGIGKTSAARALAMESEWFAGSLPDIHSKDAALQLAGRWIVEISELRAVRNSQVEAVKSFITETVDTFRPPYGRRTAQFPRQCVFVATTNETDYLRDRTGNRRYWPVKCARIDIPGILRDREQLWAEAVHEFRIGTQWHLSDTEMRLATAEQRGRVFITELEQDVAAYLQRVTEGGQTEISVREVLIHGLNLDPDSAGYAEAARKLGSAVAEALEFAGWQKDARRGSDRRTMYRRVGDKGDKGNV